jgi:YgiT-type zinc finger domain-containing protein
MGKRLQNTQKEKISNSIDRCDLCGGELHPRETTLEIWRGEELLVNKDVPADVCEQCHEAYLSASVAARLDHFLAEPHRHRPERYLAVPQYSAVQIMGR